MAVFIAPVAGQHLVDLKLSPGRRENAAKKNRQPQAPKYASHFFASPFIYHLLDDAPPALRPRENEIYNCYEPLPFSAKGG